MSLLLKDLGRPATTGSKESSSSHRPTARETHGRGEYAIIHPQTCSVSLVLDKTTIWPAWGMEKSVGEEVGGDSAYGPVVQSAQMQTAQAAWENCPLLQIGFSILVGE